MEINFPHIRYLAHPKDKRQYELFYAPNHDSKYTGLIIGKKYKISKALYADTPGVPRLSVWYCKEGDKHYKFIGLEDFCTLEELRDRKIDKVMLDSLDRATKINDMLFD